MKTCKKCGGKEFYASGLCKQCSRQRKKKWRDAHPKQMQACREKWASEHKEEFLEIRRKLEKKHAVKRKLKDAKVYQKNREKRLAQNKKWYAEHPEAGCIYKQNRREKIKNSGGTLSKDISQRLYQLQRGKCACCAIALGKKFHRDHIIPLALGGLNIDSNIQLLCKPCNLSKHAKHPIDFMQSRGFLL